MFVCEQLQESFIRFELSNAVNTMPCEGQIASMLAHLRAHPTPDNYLYSLITEVTPKAMLNSLIEPQYIYIRRASLHRLRTTLCWSDALGYFS